MNKLFVSHLKAQCGIWQCGDQIANALVKYGDNWHYRCMNDLDTFNNTLEELDPAAIVFNYFPLTMGYWYIDHTAFSIEGKLTRLGIAHEYFPYYPVLFDYFVGLNPVAEPHEQWLIAPQGIPEYESSIPMPDIPTIGSFGFGFSNKGYLRIIEQVQKEYDEAVIRLHIPYATFGDSGGAEANQREVECRAAITKPGIKLEVTHNFLGEQGLVDWLASNTLNAFLYDDMGGRGVSSTVYWALAAKRPILINNSAMMQHLDVPDIRIEEVTMKEAIDNGLEPLDRFYRDWTMDKIAKQYDDFLVDKI